MYYPHRCYPVACGWNCVKFIACFILVYSEQLTFNTTALAVVQQVAEALLPTVAALPLLLGVAPHPVVDLVQTRLSRLQTEQGKKKLQQNAV